MGNGGRGSQRRVCRWPATLSFNAASLRVRRLSPAGPDELNELNPTYVDGPFLASVRLDVGRRDQYHLVCQPCDLARPTIRRAAGLHPDSARRNPRKERQELASTDLAIDSLPLRSSFQTTRHRSQLGALSPRRRAVHIIIASAAKQWSRSATVWIARAMHAAAPGLLCRKGSSQYGCGAADAIDSGVIGRRLKSTSTSERGGNAH